MPVLKCAAYMSWNDMLKLLKESMPPNVPITRERQDEVRTEVWLKKFPSLDAVKAEVRRLASQVTAPVTKMSYGEYIAAARRMYPSRFAGMRNTEGQREFAAMYKAGVPLSDARPVARDESKSNAHEGSTSNSHEGSKSNAHDGSKSNARDEPQASAFTKHPGGFTNYGNTCFVNAILQLMSVSWLKHLPETACETGNTAYLTEEERVAFEREKTVRTSLCSIRKEVVACMSGGDPKTLVHLIWQNPSFPAKIQGDTAELYASVLSRCFTPTEMVKGAWLVQQSTECACGYREKSVTTMSCGPLNLAVGSETKRVSVGKLLLQLQMQEPGVEKLCCRCKKNMPHSKTDVLCLQRDTTHVVITIGRFNNAMTKQSFQLELSRSVTLDGFSFQLVAVVNHMGSTMSDGHYNADILTSVGWKRVDDDIVTDIQGPGTYSRTAYVLLYKKSSAAKRKRDPTPDDVHEGNEETQDRSTVPELKRRCRELHVPVTGSRDDLLDNIAQASQSQKDVEPATALSYRFVDHRWEFLKDVKEDMRSELRSRSICERTGVMTDMQRGLECGYNACFLATRLRNNPCASVNLPTHEELSLWFGKHAANFGMNPKRLAAVRSAFALRTCIPPLTTLECEKYCCDASIKYFSKYGQASSTVTVRQSDVCVLFVSREKGTVGHFLVVQFMAAGGSTGLTSFERSLKAPAKAMHPFFSQRTCNAWAAIPVCGYVAVQATSTHACSICRNMRLAGVCIPPSVWTLGTAGPFTSTNALNTSYNAHKKSAAHMGAVVLHGSTSRIGHIFAVFAAVTLVGARVACAVYLRLREHGQKEGNTSPVEAEEVVRSSLFRDVRSAVSLAIPEDVEKSFLNLHIPIFVRAVHGVAYKPSALQIQGDVLRGIALPAKYHHRHHIAEMVRLWARLVRAETSLMMEDPLGLCLVLDCVTFPVLRTAECTGVCARFFDSKKMEVTEKYLGVFHLLDGEESNGLILFRHVKHKIAEFGLAVDCVTGITADKGSNLCGVGIGVVGQFRANGAPRCQSLCDIAHRLETHAQTAFEDRAISVLVSTWQDIEATLRGSRKLLRKFKKFCVQNSFSVLHPGKSRTIRWLPKVFRLFTRAERMWQPLVRFMLEQRGAWKSADARAGTNNLGDKREQFLRVLRLKSHKRNFTVCLPALQVLSQVSVAAQTDGASIVVVVRQLRQAKDLLEQHAEGHTQVVALVTSLRALLEEFNTGHPHAVLTVCDFPAILHMPQEDVPAYGNEEIEFFARVVGREFACVLDWRARWLQFKNCLRSMQKGHSPEVSFKLAMEETQRTDGIMFRLMATACVHARYDSNTLERLFSHLKRTIGVDRTNLTVSQLEDEYCVVTKQELLDDPAELSAFLRRGIRLWKQENDRRLGGTVRRAKPKDRARPEIKFVGKEWGDFWAETTAIDRMSVDESSSEEEEQEEEEEEEEEVEETHDSSS